MKKNIKRLAAVITAVLCVFTLVACGNTTEQDKAFVCGTVNGNVYESKFAGLKMTAPEGWTYSSEEEILNMMNIATDEVLSDSKKKELELAKQKTIYDCMVTNAENGANVIIMYENMSATIGGSSYTPETYSEALGKQLSDAYTKKGEEKKTFCGEEYLCATWTVESQGVSVSYLLRKVDDYMLAICFSYIPSLGTTFESFEGMFEALPADAE